MRSGWHVIALRLPRFGTQYVWIAVTRREPADYIARCRRARTPTGISVTAGGAEIATDLLPDPTEARSRRAAEAAADAHALSLSSDGFRVLSDPRAMARLRNAQRASPQLVEPRSTEDRAALEVDRPRYRAPGAT